MLDNIKLSLNYLESEYSQYFDYLINNNIIDKEIQRIETNIKNPERKDKYNYEYGKIYNNVIEIDISSAGNKTLLYLLLKYNKDNMTNKDIELLLNIKKYFDKRDIVITLGNIIKQYKIGKKYDKLISYISHYIFINKLLKTTYNNLKQTDLIVLRKTKDSLEFIDTNNKIKISDLNQNNKIGLIISNISKYFYNNSLFNIKLYKYVIRKELNSKEILYIDNKFYNEIKLSFLINQLNNMYIVDNNFINHVQELTKFIDVKYTKNLSNNSLLNDYKKSIVLMLYLIYYYKQFNKQVNLLEIDKIFKLLKLNVNNVIPYLYQLI